MFGHGDMSAEPPLPVGVSLASGMLSCYLTELGTCQGIEAGTIVNRIIPFLLADEE